MTVGLLDTYIGVVIGQLDKAGSSVRFRPLDHIKRLVGIARLSTERLGSCLMDNLWLVCFREMGKLKSNCQIRVATCRMGITFQLLLSFFLFFLLIVIVLLQDL